ncbi:pilus assembly FimT family protein [Aquihabitans sp. McL0605]|uniref:pilus assembly FimT family protein n=1 Tax=Aquihabitans sp. McL0605 TaxID=3415671 RepID=UPI003CE7B5F2
MVAVGRKHRSASTSGFTIAELVLVLVVFTGLVLVAVVSLRGIRSDRAATDCDTELRALKAASSQYEAQFGVAAPDLDALTKVGLHDVDSIDGWTYNPGAKGEDPTFEPARAECR